MLMSGDGFVENIRTRATLWERFVTLCAPCGLREEADEVAADELVLAVGVAQRDGADEDEQPLLLDAFVVVRADGVARIELVERAAELPGADALAELERAAAVAGREGRIALDGGVVEVERLAHSPSQ